MALLGCVFGLSLVSCSSSSPGADATDDAGGSPNDAFAGAEDDAAMVTGVRGQRYCEILLATINGEMVHVEVYNSFGLNDCPDEAWSRVDATAVATDEGVNQAILNGPRYWTLDAFVRAVLVDPTPRTLGGIAMRQAGSIDLSLAEAMARAPYAEHHIQRNTTVLFSAGNSVYELVDPQGKVYEMQSYSTQIVTQGESDLAELGSKLTLPAGWSFRTRILAEDLSVTAVGGIGIVVQDDFDNTYQQSQQ